MLIGAGDKGKKVIWRARAVGRKSYLVPPLVLARQANNLLPHVPWAQHSIHLLLVFSLFSKR